MFLLIFEIQRRESCTGQANLCSDIQGSTKRQSNNLRSILGSLKVTLTVEHITVGGVDGGICFSHSRPTNLQLSRSLSLSTSSCFTHPNYADSVSSEKTLYACLSHQVCTIQLSSEHSRKVQRRYLQMINVRVGINQNRHGGAVSGEKARAGQHGKVMPQPFIYV